LVSAVGPSSVSTLADYAAFSTQLNAVKPSATQMASYNPTNTQLACPSVSPGFWAAAQALPPKPDTNVCSCMVSSLTCTAKAGLDTASIGTLFATVCATPGACANIIGNATTGVYGAFSMCNATERLANAFNTYYNGLTAANKATGCDFGGNATLVAKPVVAASCSVAISAATSSAAVANAAAATGGSGSGSGSSAGAASSTSKKSDGGDAIVGASLGLGKYFGVGFSLIAGFSGMGMLLL